MNVNRLCCNFVFSVLWLHKNVFMEIRPVCMKGWNVFTWKMCVCVQERGQSMSRSFPPQQKTTHNIELFQLFELYAMLIVKIGNQKCTKNYCCKPYTFFSLDCLWWGDMQRHKTFKINLQLSTIRVFVHNISTFLHHSFNTIQMLLANKFQIVLNIQTDSFFHRVEYSVRL